MEEKKKKEIKGLILCIIFVIIGIAAAYFITNIESPEARQERVMRESTEELRKADQQRIEAEENYKKAVEEAEKTQKELDNLQKETGIDINDLLQKIDADNE